jgi:hypothetical protein
MLDESAREDLIERITAIFTNEAEAGKFNEDPDAYADEHLPEGTEGADVAACLPEVGYRTGLDFSNVASTGGGAGAAGQLSHTYETIYQQNSFIYAEEGAQVTNIQGDGNAVSQQDVDVDIDVDYGEGETEEPPVLEETPEVPEDAPEPVEMTLPEPVGPAPETLPEEEFDQPNLVGDLDDAPEAPMETAVEEPAEAPEPMDAVDAL